MVRQCGLAKVYVATAETHTGDIPEKIVFHRARRSGQGWRTVKSPHDTANALAHLESGEVALVDDMTSWLRNLMIDDGDWEEELDVLLDVLVQLRMPVVLVSNDMAGGALPADTQSLAFQRALGLVNQRLVEQSDLVVYVTAGLPNVLKGEPQLDEVDDPW